MRARVEEARGESSEKSTRAGIAAKVERLKTSNGGASVDDGA
jgi:hypothetical protein